MGFVYRLAPLVYWYGSLSHITGSWEERRLLLRNRTLNMLLIAVIRVGSGGQATATTSATITHNDRVPRQHCRFCDPRSAIWTQTWFLNTGIWICLNVWFYVIQPTCRKSESKNLPVYLNNHKESHTNLDKFYQRHPLYVKPRDPVLTTAASQAALWRQPTQVL